VPKTVSLAIVDEEGRPLGVLPSFEVDFPYWQETTKIVAGAREHYGVEVTVLRILTTSPGVQSGGAVSYLAQADGIPAAYAGPIDVDLSPHPDRAAYAEPGGPKASLRWAETALAALNHGPVNAATQHRTWNLSTIWQLDTPAGPVWLKQVPLFFRHEAPVLRWLAGVHAPSVPVLLASADGRMLLDHIAGEDLYHADLELRAAIAVDFHRLQAASVGQVAQLLALGVPDRRTDPLLASISGVVARFGGDDVRLRDLVDGLPTRMAAVAACGVPDALVHGDLHPGNVRGDRTRRVIIDWGDSCVAHPAFDIMRLTETLDPRSAEPLVDAWARRWQQAAPASRPLRALELLRPVGALRNAVTYAHFLDQIEPAEHPYHAADVPFWLGQAADLAGEHAFS
jgi:hypothetical protein